MGGNLGSIGTVYDETGGKLDWWRKIYEAPRSHLVFMCKRSGWVAETNQWWRMDSNLVGGWSPVVFPRAQYWAQSFLIIVLMIWMRGVSAPSIRSLTAPGWVGVLTCCRAGRGLDRLGPLVWASTECVEMVQSSAREGLGWTLGRISLLEHGQTLCFLGRLLIPKTCQCLRHGQCHE